MDLNSHDSGCQAQVFHLPTGGDLSFEPKDVITSDRNVVYVYIDSCEQITVAPSLHTLVYLTLLEVEAS